MFFFNIFADIFRKMPLKPFLKQLHKRFYLTFLLLIFAAKLTFATPTDSINYIFFKDLQSEWQVFDDKYKAYVPYISSRHKGTKTISFWLDTEKFRHYHLIIKLKKDEYLFINQQLHQIINKDGWHSYKIDSLQDISSNKKIFLTFYNKSASVGLTDSFIGVFSGKIITKKVIKSTATSLQEYFKQKINNPKTNIIVFVGILIFAFYTLLWNIYPRHFYNFLNIKKLFSLARREDENALNKPLSAGNILFVAGCIFLASYFGLMFQEVQSYKLPFLVREGSIFVDMYNYFLFILLFGALIAGKFILIVFLERLLGLDKISNAHFYEHVRFSQILYVLLCGLGLYYFIVNPYNILNFKTLASVILLFGFIARSIFLWIHVNKISGMRNIYLISYLCASEIIPLLIYIKLLLF